MSPLPKTVLHFGAAALAVGALVIAAPKAAKAIAATLVQVTNTTANPAIVQGTHLQASQIVNLSITDDFYLARPGQAPFTDYTVPANQSLVITAADIGYYGATGTCTGQSAVTLWGGPIGSSQVLWVFYTSAPGPTHMNYNSGIVIPAGVTPHISGGGISCSPHLQVQLSGYLTAN